MVEGSLEVKLPTIWTDDCRGPTGVCGTEEESMVGAPGRSKYRGLVKSWATIGGYWKGAMNLSPAGNYSL